MVKPRKSRPRGFCLGCCWEGELLDGDRCPLCYARVRRLPDNSVELRVTGMANEVESVSARLMAELLPAQVKPENVTEVSERTVQRWARSRKAWALAIGLTTIAGGVAAVLALFIH